MFSMIFFKCHNLNNKIDVSYLSIYKSLAMVRISAFHCRMCSCFVMLFLCVIFSTTVRSQPVLSLTPVISTGLNQPLQFVHAGDSSNRVFIVQRVGGIKVYDASFNFLSIFLTVPNVALDGERGLLSMAFHPNYKTNGFFYVHYVNLAGNIEVDRYHVSNDPNVADPTSKAVVIIIPHPGPNNHNGGELHFGSDGFLYISTGDGGGGGDNGNNAQSITKLLGKMLRIDVNTSSTAPYYTIPPGNPYGNEIFASGLRNPFRWSFDRNNYDMWIGDVGQESFEEVDYRPKDSTTGANYGWRCYEANSPFNIAGCNAISNYVFPVYNYPTPNPAGAITGGLVYRGSAYPSLQGYYLSADFFTGIFNLTTSDGTGGWTTTTQTLTPTGIGDFGETESGEVYVCSVFNGIVSRVVVTPGIFVTLTNFSGTENNAGVLLDWHTTMEQNMSYYEIEYSTNGTVFTYLGSVAAQNASTGYNYSYLDISGHQEDVIYYRLKMINLDGTYQYSGIIRISLLHKVKNIITPTIVRDGFIHLNLALPLYNSIELISMNGSLVLKENIQGRIGDIKISTGQIARGMYVARFYGNTSTHAEKIIIQ